MLHCKIENILAPKDADIVIDAIEREINKGFLMDEIIHAVSNHEMFLSKVAAGPDPLSIKEAFELAQQDFQKK
jgi:hypothetical protein